MRFAQAVARVGDLGPTSAMMWLQASTMVWLLLALLQLRTVRSPSSSVLHSVQELADGLLVDWNITRASHLPWIACLPIAVAVHNGPAAICSRPTCIVCPQIRRSACRSSV